MNAHAPGVTWAWIEQDQRLHDAVVQLVERISWRTCPCCGEAAPFFYRNERTGDYCCTVCRIDRFYGGLASVDAATYGGSDGC
jgi:hypothetical protein